MRPSSTARRYAEAAFDVARQEGDVAGWLQELTQAVGGLQETGVSQYFRDPNVATSQKLTTVNEAFASLRPQAVNLLRMLAARERLGLLPAILQEMQRLDRESRDIVEAAVTVARPLTDGEQEEIRSRLSTVTGKQVEVNADVDPSILGGVVIRMGDRLIDASVAGRLERLRQDLTV